MKRLFLLLRQAGCGLGVKYFNGQSLPEQEIEKLVKGVDPDCPDRSGTGNAFVVL